MATVGRACLILALAVCVYGVAAALYGARARRPDWVESARRSVYALAVLATVSFAVLEIAFLRSDFSFGVVVDECVATTSNEKSERRNAISTIVNAPTVSAASA